MEIVQPYSWDQRANGVGPMPGGYSGYLTSLRKTCTYIEDAGRTFEELVRWLRDEFDISETSSRHCLGFLRKAGLVCVSNGVVSNNREIRYWLQNAGDHIPISVIHSRVRFVGEMLSELREPKPAVELLRAAANYGLVWRTHAQIQRRRGWLESANLIDGANGPLSLTDAGRELLSQLDIYTPDRIATNHTTKSTFRSDPPTSPISTVSAFYTLRDHEHLAGEIEVASVDSRDPARFEHLVCKAFRFIGFEAKRLGGSGRTDVLLTAPLGKYDSYRVAVDAKTTATGSLSDPQVDWHTLEEHRERHRADYSLLVAPDPAGQRLIERANKTNVALLSAQQLASLCRQHALSPLSLVEYRKVFETAGKVDVSRIDEEAEHLSGLRSLASAICRQLPETTDKYGPMSARDICLSLGEEAKEYSEDEIQRLLVVLAHPLIGVVCNVPSDRHSPPKTGYVLATRRDVSRQRICMLGDAVAAEKSKET